MVIALATLASVARADAPVANGFFTQGPGELDGSVSRADGSPAAHATVHVVTEGAPEQRATTDARGRYRVTLRGGHAHVFITEPGKVVGTTTASAPSAGDDVIEIHEAEPPAVAARPKKPADRILDYSDAAMEADTWTRAWLMLHVDARGMVTHVKLLRAAGYDLDAIAMRAAFALRFEPARDRAQRPIRSLVLWTFEWPAYWWLRQTKQPLSRLPADVADVRCRRADRPRKWDRDCSEPDLAGAQRRPWLARRKK